MPDGLDLLVDSIDSALKNRVFLDWVLSNEIMLDGRAFSFQGFEELETIYADMHPDISIRKSVQVGITVYLILFLLWRASQLGLTGIYFLPTDDMVKTFTPHRINPVCESVPSIRDNLRISSAELKQINNAFIYILGLNTKTKVASIPSHTNVFDEFDLANPENSQEALDRLSRSSAPMIRRACKPTLPGCGIDKHFQETDQRYLFFICPKCNHENNVVLDFPKNIFEYPQKHKKGSAKNKGQHYIGCMKCGAELSPKNSRWIPLYPSITDKRGYHLCKLYWNWTPAGFASVADMVMDNWKKADDEIKTRQVYQSDLGLPYAGDMKPITDEDLDRAHGVHFFIPVHFCSYMGVDQGDNRHIVILHPDNHRLVIHSLYIDTATNFSFLDELMVDHHVWCCVIDALPNHLDAVEFALRHEGYVYIQYFQGSEVHQDKETWLDDRTNKEKEVLVVDVPRTESLELTCSKLKKSQIILPARTASPLMETFRDHFKNLTKQKVATTKGRFKIEFPRTNDHFAMATNSARIATTLPAIRPMGLALYPAFGRSLYEA